MTTEPPAAQALNWPSPRIELNPGIEAFQNAPVEARFSFTNTGSAPWEIVSSDPDCGCTVAEISKRRVAPGESGEIVVRFTVGDRVGRQEKRIVVRGREAIGDTAAQPVARLTLVVNLPELVRISPARITWTLGEPVAPKTMLVEAQFAEMPIARLSAKSTQAMFQPEVRVLEEGRRYEIVVTPLNTGILVTGHLPIRCEFARPAGAQPSAGENPPKLFVVVADIAPPQQGPATAAAPAAPAGP